MPAESERGIAECGTGGDGVRSAGRCLARRRGAGSRPRRRERLHGAAVESERARRGIAARIGNKVGSRRYPKVRGKIRLECECTDCVRRVGENRVQLIDALRNSPATWKLHATALTLKSFAQSAPEDKLLALAQAFRRWPSRSLERRLAPWLGRERGAIWREKKIGWGRFQQRNAARPLIKSLILKAPGTGGEEGVPYV